MPRESRSVSITPVAHVQNDNHEPATLQAKDHAILTYTETVVPFLAFQLAHVAILRRGITPNGNSDALSHLAIDATQIAKRRSSPDDLAHRVRSSSATQSPRR